MNSRSLLRTLADELALLLDPLSGALQSPEAMERLLARLGIFDPEAAGPVSAFAAAHELTVQLDTLAAQDALTFESARAALQASRAAFALAEAARDVGGAAGAVEGLGRDLVDLLFETWLTLRHPVARELLALLTLLEIGTERPAQMRGDVAVRFPVRLDRLRLDRLPALLRDPADVLEARYVNALASDEDAAAMADRLFPQVVQLLRALGISCRYGFKPGDEVQLGDAAPLMKHALIVYATDPLLNDEPEAGVVLNLSPASRGDLGLVLSPFGTLAFTRRVGRCEVRSSLSGQVDALAWGRHGLTLPEGAEDAEISAGIAASLVPRGEGPAYVLGAEDGTRIDIGGATVSAQMQASQARQRLTLAADLSDAALVIAPGDGDGFLRSLLPAEGMRAEFGLGLTWSSEKGLALRGGAGLDATFPVGLSMGAVTLSTIHVSLQAQAEVQAAVSASLAASIGPVRVSVERVGIAATATFPESGGNVGVMQLDLGLKPPDGAGLSIDEAVVTGGGFLRFVPETAQYEGMVELNLEGGIAVKGIGLIATRLPEGRSGYSLLIIITAEGFQPVPLPLGFKLTGIGGLLALNRSFAEQALRAGIKDHALDGVLFPEDPVRNAPQILGNLNRAFPPAEGHHLFGPMARIVWGTPVLITADVALVLEFGARLRLLILARVTAILPKPDHDLVRLRMDAVGLLDFDQGTAALDATLHDSRLLKKFALTGDMAMRLKWEGAPNFALAVGGLHPAFNPPADFPRLERITLNLCAGDNPRLRCEAYFALTANTIQFGARAELYAAAAGFSILGQVGFDVLIQPDPFHFLADFLAQVQLKRGSTNLFKVRVQGALEGPRPLHLKAKASFEVLWWDVSIRIDRTLVEGEPPPPPEPVDVLPRLRAALEDPSNWSSRLPAGQRPMVTLRGEPSTEVRLHPLGILTVKQNVVPLDLEISRFGQAAPAGMRRFSLGNVTLGDARPTTGTVRDFFAPAQFFDLSDDEKLSRPSFEPLAAGLAIGSETFALPEGPDERLEVTAIEFETYIVDKAGHEVRPSHRGDEGRYTLATESLLRQARFGAAGGADLRRAGRERFRSPTAPRHHAVKEGWSIVATDDLSVRSMPGRAGPASYSEALQALETLRREDPARAGALKIMRLSELREGA